MRRKSGVKAPNSLANFVGDYVALAGFASVRDVDVLGPVYVTVATILVLDRELREEGLQDELLVSVAERPQLKQVLHRVIVDSRIGLNA